MDLASIGEMIRHLVYAVGVIAALTVLTSILSAYTLFALRRERAIRAKEREEDAKRWNDVTSRLFPEKTLPALSAPARPPLTEFFSTARASSPSPEPPEPPPRGTMLPRRGR